MKPEPRKLRPTPCRRRPLPRARGLERDLDAVVVVEQRRGRHLLVFGEGEHPADRKLGPVTGGADRPQQHEERDRQRDRSKRQKQRELVAEDEPAQTDHNAPAVASTGLRVARGPSAPAGAERRDGRAPAGRHSGRRLGVGLGALGLGVVVSP